MTCILGVESFLDIFQEINIAAGLRCDPLVLKRLGSCQSLLGVGTQQALDKVPSYIDVNHFVISSWITYMTRMKNNSRRKVVPEGYLQRRHPSNNAGGRQHCISQFLQPAAGRSLPGMVHIHKAYKEVVKESRLSVPVLHVIIGLIETRMKIKLRGMNGLQSVCDDSN
jgi:hypothetical protein